MEYKDFEKLYRSDTVVFHLGMELFAENGREAIASSTAQELRTAIAGKLSGFFMEEKILDVVNAAKDFAGLKTIDLLSYTARCGIKLEDDPVDEPGVCPLCGGTLIYGEEVSANRPHAVGWVCEDCGATGKEAYREMFDCHYDVRNSDGELVIEHDQKK